MDWQDDAALVKLVREGSLCHDDLKQLVVSIDRRVSIRRTVEEWNTQEATELREQAAAEAEQERMSAAETPHLV